jgi:O-antigen ligase
MPQFYLICLAVYVVAAVASQSVLDLSIFLMTLGWLSQFIRPRSRPASHLNWIGIEWAFIGYMLVVGLGFYLNAAADAEVARSFSKFVWILNLYVLIYVFQKVQIKEKAFLKFLCFAFLIPNLYALLGYTLGTDPITGREADRIIGFVASATYHAHGNAMIFTFFSALLFFNFQKLSFWKKQVVLVAYLIFFFSIFLTFTRGIWISIFVSSVIMGFLIHYKKTLRIVFSTVVVMSIFYFLWPQFKTRINHSFNSHANEERINLFKVNVQIWEEYPLLGLGYGENLRRNREYWDRPEWKMPADYITSHAHNQYLNVMATTGLWGLFFYLSFSFYFLKRNWVLFKKTHYEKSPFRSILVFSCLWAQIQFLLACLTDVSFEYAKIRSLLVIVWALVVAIDLKPSLVSEEST